MPAQAMDSKDERPHKHHRGLRLLLTVLLVILMLGPVAFVHWSASPVFCGPIVLFGPHSHGNVMLSNVASATTSPRGASWTWTSQSMRFDPRRYDGVAFRITNKKIWKLGLITVVQR